MSENCGPSCAACCVLVRLERRLNSGAALNLIRSGSPVTSAPSEESRWLPSDAVAFLMFGRETTRRTLELDGSFDHVRSFWAARCCAWVKPAERWSISTAGPALRSLAQQTSRWPTRSAVALRRQRGTRPHAKGRREAICVTFRHRNGLRGARSARAGTGLARSSSARSPSTVPSRTPLFGRSTRCRDSRRSSSACSYVRLRAFKHRARSTITAASPD